MTLRYSQAYKVMITTAFINDILMYKIHSLIFNNGTNNPIKAKRNNPTIIKMETYSITHSSPFHS